MKKIITGLLVIASLTVNAQKGTTSLSIGLNHGSSLNNNLTNKLGQNISLLYGIGKKGNINLNYTTFQNKIKFTEGTVNNRFLTLGYQQYFGEKKNIFVTTEAGISFGDSKTQPLISLGAGYSFRLNNFAKLEVGAKYIISQNNASNNNWLLLNVGLKINLGKK